MTAHSARATRLRTVAATSIALAAAMEPVFLLSALSPQIGDEMAFGPTAIGLSITAFFVSAAVSAIPLGRLTERIGLQRSLHVGVSISAAVCLMIAMFASYEWHFLVLLSLGGLSMGFVEGASASALTGHIRKARQGIAYGVRQASVPAASLLAGLSVPLVAIHMGWRVAFGSGVILGPLAWRMLPPMTLTPRVVGRRVIGHIVHGRPITILTLGIAMGASAASAAATFLLPAITANGIPPATAGFVLAAGSIASGGVRLATGWVADHGTRTPAGILIFALSAGAVGAVILAVSQGVLLTAAGAILLLGAGWGWTGLAYLAVVQAVPHAPAAVAGIILTGMTGGSAFGPFAFSALAATTSYRIAWVATAALLLLAAAVTTLARVGLESSGGGTHSAPSEA